ncbi:MAG TPA: hypothetical protein PLU72_19200 [Candidatus Ozemobacteraceae bacterium]|nr:hypothetical protein [Candidatus Ozemobacteraceae bacterium]HQG27335.1 hypothetical protein [Candidatus Ozemobacteraceae bacterium]
MLKNIYKVISIFIMTALLVCCFADPASAQPMTTVAIKKVPPSKIGVIIRFVRLLLVAKDRYDKFRRWSPPLPQNSGGHWLGSLLALVAWVAFDVDADPVIEPKPLRGFGAYFEQPPSPVLPAYLRPGPDGL